MIPTKIECEDLMKAYFMLNNIINHSLKVKEIGLYVTEKLNQRGYKFNKEIVQAACLLHDITKTYHIYWDIANKGECKILSPPTSFTEKDVMNKFETIAKKVNFKGDTPHEISAKLLLDFEGYPKIGDIVRLHASSDVNHLSYEGILCYSDRHVLHENVVSFDQRFSYVLKRYFKSKEKLNNFKNKTKELAKSLETKGDFTFEQLRREL